MIGRFSTSRLLSCGTLAVAVALLVVAPSASGTPLKPGKCVPGLASGISWDHSDPAYLQQFATVRWKNCKGAIRTVVLEMRGISPEGGVEDSSFKKTLTADIAHHANGEQTYSKGYFLLWRGGVYNSFTATGGVTGTDLKSCTQFANGSDATKQVAGRTWYTVATAYDRGGKAILKKVSPPVVCDQNG